MILKISRGLYCRVHIEDGQKTKQKHNCSFNKCYVCEAVMVSVFFRGFDSTLFEALHCGQEVTVVRDA